MKVDAPSLVHPDSKYICEYCEYAILRYGDNYPPDVGDILISEIDLQLDNFKSRSIDGVVVYAKEINVDNLNSGDAGDAGDEYDFKLEFSTYVNDKFREDYFSKNSKESNIDVKFLDEFPIILKFVQISSNVWKMIISVDVRTSIDSFLAPVPGYVYKEAAKIRDKQIRSTCIPGTTVITDILKLEDIGACSKSFDELPSFSQIQTLYHDQLSNITFLNPLIFSKHTYSEEEQPGFNFWRQRYVPNVPTFSPLRIKYSAGENYQSHITIQENSLNHPYFSENFMMGILEKLLPMFQIVIDAANNQFIPGAIGQDVKINPKKSLIDREFINLVIGFRDINLAQDETIEDCWKTEGIANDNIEAVGIFVLKNSNTFGSDIEFRRFVQKDEDELVTKELSSNDVIQFDRYKNIDVIPLGTHSLTENSAIVFPGSYISKFTDMMPKEQGHGFLRLIHVWLIDSSIDCEPATLHSSEDLAKKRNDAIIGAQNSDYYDCGSVSLPYLYC